MTQKELDIYLMAELDVCDPFAVDPDNQWADELRADAFEARTQQPFAPDIVRIEVWFADEEPNDAAWARIDTQDLGEYFEIHEFLSAPRFE